MNERPALIAHADWGKDPRKRWLATARWRGDHYEATPATPVTDTAGLLRSLTAQADGGAVLAGFDFPIGLPTAYANAAGILNFRHFFRCAARQRITLRPELRAQIAAGFGDRADGEDPFDATVGLLAMINFVQGHQDADPSLPMDVLNIEGWMLGLAV